VFSQGYRPGTLGQRGFSPEAVAQLRPGIVFVSLCAFSHVDQGFHHRSCQLVVEAPASI
jgi:crotonobetainyl-CoA:carnitine CoA-transferase CaiB-like acyl-CoA transferase